MLRTLLYILTLPCLLAFECYYDEEVCNCEETLSEYKLECNRTRYFDGSTSLQSFEKFRKQLINKTYEATIRNKMLLFKIKANTFTNMSISTLDLSCNTIEIIDQRAFVNVKSVSNLNFSSNRLTNLSDLVVGLSKLINRELRSLASLDVSYNLIEKLDFEFPLSMENLTNLNLSSNRIWFLGSFVFKNLKSLRFLDLENNYLKTIESSSVFSYMPRLQTIKINNLEMDLNNQSFLNRLFNLNATTVRIEHSYLPNVLSLRNVKILSLVNNEIKHIIVNSLSVNLTQLDLSKNKLTSIKKTYFRGLFNLQKLDLDLNTIRYIEKDSFADLRKLITLYMRKNYALRAIDFSTFAGISALKILHLDLNMINWLNGDTFKNMPNLVSLNIAYNLLDNLTKDTFSNLKKIESIKMDYQSITSIESHTFCNLASLETIDLNGNRLVELLDNTFTELVNLIELDLSDNFINKIEVNTFVNLTNNKLSVNLSKNRIKLLNASDNFLAGLPGVRKLDLSRNQIEKVESFVFSKCGQLEFLDLKDNRLNILGKNLFAETQKALLVLNLADNKIQLIKRHDFFNLTRLNKIYLSNNQISSIESDSFESLVRLKIIDLNNNMIFNLEARLFVKSTHLSYMSLKNMNYLSMFRVEDKNLGRLSELIMFKMPVIFNYMFRNSSSLRKLNMADCSVQIIEAEAFFELSSLLELYLDYNRIQYLNSSLKWLTGLIRLDLSFNRIEFITFADFSSLVSLQNLCLDHNNLKVFDVSNSLYGKLLALSVKNVSLKLIESIEFSRMENIEHLDLSENSLSSLNILASLNNLKTLIMRNCFYTLVDQFSFQSLIDKYNYLTVLAIENSYSSMKFENTAVKNRLYFLQNLTLNRIGLQSIEDLKLDFTFMKNIQSITLSNNYIKIIKREFFAFMPKLDWLDLSYNMINSIEPNSFLTSEAIYLNLAFNQINSFEGNYINIRYLGLAGNSLTTFDNVGIEGVFHTYLYFDQNNLTSFPRSILTSKVTAHTIVLSGNRIISLPSLNKSDALDDISLKLNSLYLNRSGLRQIQNQSILTNCNFLFVLDLSGNYLTEMADSLDNMFRLRHLNLSANMLSIIRKRFLLSGSNLQTLDLSFNRIKFIEDYSFELFVSLKTLYLNGNPGLLVMNQTRSQGLPLLHIIYISVDFLDEHYGENFNAIKSMFPKKYFNNFIFSVYVNYIPQIVEHTLKDCLYCIIFIKHNVHLNLITDNDVDLFLKNCQVYFNIFFNESQSKK
jgi:Leucine-rich repeat (LRR) protein